MSETERKHEPMLELGGEPIKGLKRCLHCGLSETYWDRWPQCESKSQAKRIEAQSKPMPDKPETLESLIAKWRERSDYYSRLSSADGYFEAKPRCYQECANDLLPIAARLRERDEKLRELVREMRECADYKDTHTLPENRNPYKTGFGDGFKWALGKLEIILGKE